MPTAIAASIIRYCTSAADGVLTVMTEQANPAMRRPNTASTALVMAKPRLCRVVRGVPRKAKVSTEKAKG